MSIRRSSQQNRCPKCLVHTNNCYCEKIIPTELLSKVSIILFKKEKFLPSNTAIVTSKSLTNTETFIRGNKDSFMNDSFVDSENYHPLYLYPTDDSIELTQDFVSTIKKPINLIVPDGTWRQTKKIHKREPLLRDITKVRVTSKNKSIYPLRRQKFDYGLCTHEAIAHALKIIENEVIYEKMIENLNTMIKAHLINRQIHNKL